ncbi:phage tail protein [Streptococcus hepaticus]|uniref:phage tail protein n=1 Tax=Streptococcus hepaticus TaxID=3349163 RepID=UPI003D1621AE
MIESTEAFKKFANGQSWQDLDYNTQQQIRLMAILEQATSKYGDTLSNSVNGRVSLFKSLLKDAALNIGNALLPVVNAVMPVLNSLAMALKNITAKLAEFVGLMFNKKASVKNGAVANANKGLQDAAGTSGDLNDALGDAGSGADDMADSLGGAAKQAKKVKSELLGLAGFDEISILKANDGDDSSSGGKGKGGKGSGAGGGFNDILPEIELTDMDNNFKSIFDGWGDKLKGLFDLFKKGFNASFRAEGLERIRAAVVRIGKTLQEIFTDPKVVKSFQTMLDKIAYALGQFVGSLATVAVGFGVFVAESIANGLERQKERIKSALVSLFINLGIVAEAAGNIAQELSNGFYDAITSSGAVRIGSAIVSAVLSAGSTIIDIGSRLGGDLAQAIEKIVTDNVPKLSTTLQNMFTAIVPFFETFETYINDAGATISKLYDKHIAPFIESFSGGFSEIIGTLIDGWNAHINPVLTVFGEKFSQMYDEHIKPAIDNISKALGSLFDFIKTIWEENLQPYWNMLAEVLMPILALLADFLLSTLIVVIERIAGTIGGISLALSGLLDFLTGVFTGDWDKAWNGIKDLFKGIIDTLLANLGIDIDEMIDNFKRWWREVVAVFTPVAQWFQTKFNEAWTFITGIFTPLSLWFSQKYEELKSNLSSIPSWFSSKFREAWNNVTNAFASVGSFFQGIYSHITGMFGNIGVAVGDAIGGAFRYAVNAVLSTAENAINWFIDAMNGVINIINAVPGVSLGYVPSVNFPRLARGGIVDSPTMAMIGEAGKEVVMPLENTGFLQTMGRVVGSAVVGALGGGLPQAGGFSGDGDIVINIGGQEFGRFAIREINRAQEQAGEILLNI